MVPCESKLLICVSPILVIFIKGGKLLALPMKPYIKHLPRVWPCCDLTFVSLPILLFKKEGPFLFGKMDGAFDVLVEKCVKLRTYRSLERG